MFKVAALVSIYCGKSLVEHDNLLKGKAFILWALPNDDICFMASLKLTFWFPFRVLYLFESNFNKMTSQICNQNKSL